MFPWLRYKSARFYAANSTWRNLRFRFTGNTRSVYAAYLGYPLLAAITLGLLARVASFQDKRYFSGNFGCGSFSSDLTGRPGWFFKVLYLLFGTWFVMVIAVMVVGIGIATTSGSMVPAADGREPSAPGWFMVVPLVLYASLFLVFGAWTALSKNYAWNHTTMDGGATISFRSELHVGRYLWIFFSNLFLTVITLGLFAPFAAVRMYRYRVEHLAVAGVEALDHAVVVASAEANAMGESAADLFDFEFGL